MHGLCLRFRSFRFYTLNLLDPLSEPLKEPLKDPFKGTPSSRIFGNFHLGLKVAGWDSGLRLGRSCDEHWRLEGLSGSGL